MGEFDYVIVGAGSAGCVLAARLSDDPSVSVCLLEAGAPDAADEIHLPAGVLAVGQSKYDWGFLSDPEPGFDGAPTPAPTRADPRRIVLDQRDGLHPRQPHGLRRLAGDGLRRLGLGRRAAVLPARR
jgi:choline dehydrogenase-like flavoprotein